MQYVAFFPLPSFFRFIQEIPLESNCSMSWNSSHTQLSAKLFGRNGVLEEQKSPGFKKRETEVYVGNLPLDISKEEILYLLKDFNPLDVHKIQNGCKCFAFVDLGSMQKVRLAIQELNGKLFHKRKLFVNTSKRPPKRTSDVIQQPWAPLVLEKASGEGFGKTAAIIQLAPKAPVDLCETEKLRAAVFAVPLEMRGSFLVLLLRECFRDLSWLALIHSVRGEAGLLVTSIVPKTPFFWAMHITEALHQNMQALFSTLAQAEEQQPYLEGSAVKRGTRCLAEYHLGDYGHAWNRCWVLDRVDTWAVVMFIDFGQLATIPVQSLRSLDSDDFWTIPPLTQPFMLEKDILSSYEVVHRILKGKITGALNSEVTAPASNLAVVPPLLPLGSLQQAAA
ncbi:tudor domain-containing protein 10 isoform X1 [Hylobates moloch]|uniref:tudor domain-containing protein 10 isoform X1 n=2 Tax=Hylobates moloch TaxID=81572 RepID=UPI0026761322|nr:tudor domain-containing protein 10 isoform X1 [Hylobates moloch]